MVSFPLSLLDFLVLCSLWAVWLQYISDAYQGGCRRIKFIPPMNGYYFKNHVYRNLSIGIYASCEHLCVMESACVSVTVGPRIEDKVICELSNSDHWHHPEDLQPRHGWTYRGAKNLCRSNPCLNNAKCLLGYKDKRYLCVCASGYTGEHCETAISGYFDWKPVESCLDIKTIEGEQAITGAYWLNQTGVIFQAYCQMESLGKIWTHIARFSMLDAINWMKDSGEWWYDKSISTGETTDPSNNTDMISPAFWLVSGNEFKITRSDDPKHTALLQTRGDCLGGQTFRKKITSYGDFRNGSTWRLNFRCLGSCTVHYGRQYEATQGFGNAKCNGTILSGDKIGFWCDRGRWDGAVMMIGGSGSGDCGHTYHGLGITEAKIPSFSNGGRREQDFGNSPYGKDYTGNYSLNLWIR